MNVKFNYAHTTILNELIVFNCSFNVLKNGENVECGMNLIIHSFPIKHSDIKVFEIDSTPNLIEFLNSNDKKETIYRLLSDEIATGIYQMLIKEEINCQKYWVDKFNEINGKR